MGIRCFGVGGCCGLVAGRGQLAALAWPEPRSKGCPVSAPHVHSPRQHTPHLATAPHAAPARSQPYAQREVEELGRLKDITALAPFYLDLQDEVLRIQVGGWLAAGRDGRSWAAASYAGGRSVRSSSTYPPNPTSPLTHPTPPAQALTDKAKGMSGELSVATTRHGDLHLQVHATGERSGTEGQGWLGCLPAVSMPSSATHALPTPASSPLRRRGVWHRDPRAVGPAGGSGRGPAPARVRWGWGGGVRECTRAGRRFTQGCLWGRLLIPDPYCRPALPHRRSDTPEQRLEEAMEAREAAQVVLLQKHLARALHSSQLTQPAQLLCGIAERGAHVHVMFVYRDPFSDGGCAAGGGGGGGQAWAPSGPGSVVQALACTRQRLGTPPDRSLLPPTWSNLQL